MKKIFFNIKNEKYFFLILVVYFSIGSNIFTDYGISWDEVNERFSGFVSLNEVYKLFNLEPITGPTVVLPNGDIIKPEYPDLSNYIYKEYGVLFNLPLAFLENLLAIKDIKDVFLLRHFVNFLIFFISTIFFYYTLRNFYSKVISVIGFLFLILSPRIFAESFYNNKDIIFLSLYLIAFYFALKFFTQRQNKFLILFSFFVALSINIRVLGLLSIVLLFLFLFLEGLNSKKLMKKNTLDITKCLFLTSLFTYLMWPFLWGDPLDGLIYTFKSMSSYNWKGLVFFLGDYHEGKNIPWNYTIISFIITTPLLIVFLFFVGISFCAKDLINNFINIDKHKESNLWLNNFQILNILAFLNIVIMLSYIILFNSTLYGGWRHTYFLYPSVIILSLYGIKIFQNYINIKIILFFVIFSILTSLFWIINNHPFQYVYYNSLVKNNIKKNFELDYWGVSNLHTLNYLIDNYNRDKYFVFAYSNSPYHYSKNMIDLEKRNKIKFVDEIKDAEFILSNHYYLNQQPHKKDKYLFDNFEVIYKINVNNISINSIFMKKL